MSKRLIIVARYNEDLDWTKELDDEIIIYNKGDTFAWNLPHKNVPNIGREGETYIRAILDYYDKLQNYDEIVFLQGYPLDHCPQLFELLKLDFSSPYMPLAWAFANHNLPTDGYIGGMHKSTINMLMNQNRIDHNCEAENLLKIIDDISYPMDHGGYFVEKGPEIKQIIYVCMMLNIQYKNLKLNWPCGAQYRVNTKFILNKSRVWWEDFQQLFHYTHNDLKCHDFGYIIERLWPAIWKYQNKVGDWVF